MVLTVQEQATLEDVFRAGRHVPEDKRRWSPMGAARSAQAQLASSRRRAGTVHLADRG